MDVLCVGSVKFFVSLDQLREIRAAIDTHLADEESVPYDSPEWDDDGLWTTADAIDEDFSDPVRDASWNSRTDAATLLAPIAGGCDDIPAEYHPTEENWAEYHKMFDQVESDPQPPVRNALGLVSRDFAERLANGHLG
jgi:hypothetical protein